MQKRWPIIEYISFCHKIFYFTIHFSFRILHFPSYILQEDRADLYSLLMQKQLSPSEQTRIVSWGGSLAVASHCVRACDTSRATWRSEVEPSSRIELLPDFLLRNTLMLVRGVGGLVLLLDRELGLDVDPKGLVCVGLRHSIRPGRKVSSFRWQGGNLGRSGLWILECLLTEFISRDLAGGMAAVWVWYIGQMWGVSAHTRWLKRRSMEKDKCVNGSRILSWSLLATEFNPSWYQWLQIIVQE